MLNYSSRGIPIKSGIYQIRNTQNDHIYIGSACNLISRCCQHRKQLQCGTHCNDHLQKAFNHYGEEAFVFEVLEYVRPVEHLISREQYFIDTLQPAYNINPLAISQLGIKRSVETCQKISYVRQGTTHTPETRILLSIIGKNQPKPAGFGARVSASHKNRKKSPEHLASLSQARKNSPAFQAHLARLADAKRGVPNPQATKAISPEKCRKQSEAMKAVWACRRAAQQQSPPAS